MAHLRRPKQTQQRLTEHASLIIDDAWHQKGSWRSLMPDARRIHLDLGCGKGVWLSRVASQLPQDLFIGIDHEQMCVAFGAERIDRLGLKNVFFAHDTAHAITSLFASDEIDELHINCPTPYPRIKDSLQRVTDADHLMDYRRVLSETGHLHLKTDSQPYFDWTLRQFENAGYQIIWQTRDLYGEYHELNDYDKKGDIARFEGKSEYSACSGHNGSGSCVPNENGNDALNSANKDQYPDLCDLTPSAYEEKFLAMGAQIHALVALSGPEPENCQKTERESLVDYLPDDLESMDYVPHGMWSTVRNMRNRRRNAQVKKVARKTP